MSNTKECRSCKETISSEAKWCPHCHRPQSLLRAFVSPQALIVTLLVMGGYWYMTVASMEAAMAQTGGQSIYDSHEQLDVVESSVSFSKQGCDACIYTIGTVKNSTDKAWSNIHFQVTLMDQNGKVIDVINDEDSDFVLGPRSEGKFKVSGKAATDFDKYRSHTIKITKANPDTNWY